MDNKAPDAFRTISEVADELEMPQHVLRFWESRFHQIKPMKRARRPALLSARRHRSTARHPSSACMARATPSAACSESCASRARNSFKSVWQEGAPQPPHGVIEDEEFVEAVVAESAVPEEGHGLRERLSSLIGRDLGDRQDDVAARVEPSLTSAPVPRIDPADRAIHGGGVPEQSTQAPQPMSATSRQSLPGGLGREDLRKLHAALHELAECRKLIDAAVTRPH